MESLDDFVYFLEIVWIWPYVKHLDSLKAYVL